MKHLQSQILKFISAMNLGVFMEIDNQYVRGGKHHLCVRILVFNKSNEEVEYEQYHCYRMGNDGSVVYDEGNQVKGVADGVLAYIGDNWGVDNFFDEKAREMVKKRFSLK